MKYKNRYTEEWREQLKESRKKMLNRRKTDTIKWKAFMIAWYVITMFTGVIVGQYGQEKTECEKKCSEEKKSVMDRILKIMFWRY